MDGCRRLARAVEALQKAEAALEELAGVRVVDEARVILRAVRHRLERRQTRSCPDPGPPASPPSSDPEPRAPSA